MDARFLKLVDYAKAGWKKFNLNPCQRTYRKGIANGALSLSCCAISAAYLNKCTTNENYVEDLLMLSPISEFVKIVRSNCSYFFDVSVDELDAFIDGFDSPTYNEKVKLLSRFIRNSQTEAFQIGKQLAEEIFK